MANAPIQVILNADSFRRERDKQTPAGNGTDFFEGRDAAFRMHQQDLRSQVQTAIAQVSPRHAGDDGEGIGYLKVSLRAQAIAKSHRPSKAIFRSASPIVGGEHLGEMIVEVTPQSLKKIDDAIAKAEIDVRKREDKNGDEKPAPTRNRCEVGAIERIEVWGKNERRRFDIAEAIEWLSDPRTGQGYLVELFEQPPSPSSLDLLTEGKRRSFASLTKQLRELGPGIYVRVPDGLPKDSLLIEVKLTCSKDPPALFLRGSGVAKGSQRPEFDKSRTRHERLLAVLENHPLVRQIHLPHVLIRSQPKPAMPTARPSIPLPASIPGMSYPRVGIIDGGLSSEQKHWIIYQHGLLAAEHTDSGHGSFISGLVIAARAMNPGLAAEADGCLVADIDIFPSDRPGVFEQYYTDGIASFLEELATAVEQCRKQHGIRIFNLSLNVVSPVSLDRYSLEARRLDQIADELDVIFVISAGNLESKSMRPEWPSDDHAATSVLARHRDDQLFIPAESVRNLSVAAVNPHGMTNSIAGAPARYSRRGPGLRAGVKPDLCHVGGSGTMCPTQSHGLFSRAPDGSTTSACGTSYAAPLVARALATIENQIEGEPSRETLLALAIHHASPPNVLAGKAFDGLARQLVGFGQPAIAETALQGSDHEITLLFSSRIFQSKTLEFRFSWPQSLVLPGGKCKGDVRLTLVSTPNLDYRHGAEFVRSNIEAALQQEAPSGAFRSELDPTHYFFSADEQARESTLIEHMFKWSPVKCFGTRMVRGRGKSSNWRLVVNYLTRADELLPKDGIPFSVLLTISDPEKQKPVFTEMRQSLQALGVQTADIRTAARVTSRV